LDQNEILFLFLPAQQWAEMFRVFHIETGNGLTLYFTEKAILEQIIIPKGTILENYMLLPNFRNDTLIN